MKHLAIAALALAATASPALAQTSYVVADRMLDVKTGKYLDRPVIAVENGKVQSVSSGAPPAGGSPMTIRIAMWSGPRNLSTAMMRSFSSRADTFVSDEPFYGAYLKETGDRSR